MAVTSPSTWRRSWHPEVDRGLSRVEQHGVVARDEQSDAARGRLGEHACDDLRAGLVELRRRLVEHGQHRLHGESPRELDRWRSPPESDSTGQCAAR